MLEIKPAPEFDGEPLETYWPGDPAIDAPQSDLVAWCRNGDMGALVLREEQTASLIRYKPLGRRALQKVRSLLLSGDPNAFAEACRFGLVEVEDVKLQRTHQQGLWGLTDVCLDSLSDELKGGLFKLPMSVLIAEVFRAGKVGAIDEKPDRLEETSLPEAIGGLVLLATFCLG